MTWFDVDRHGLRAQLERRGIAFAIFELAQNAWDSGSPRVRIHLEPLAGAPFAVLEVEDWSERGFEDLSHAWTLFAPSLSAKDPEKRGRFNSGEKLVLALARSAHIETVGGGVRFDDDGRKRLRGVSRSAGTLIRVQMRMTREQIAEVTEAVDSLIPPVETTFNGRTLEMPAPVKVIDLRLPTEIAGDDGIIRRTTRKTRVAIYGSRGGPGEILEMGIPVVEADFAGFRADVLQKIPLNSDRDNVPPSFVQTLRVAVLNAVHGLIEGEDVSSPAVTAAIDDSRCTGEAFKSIVRKRFGDRAVVAVPGDPVANARAEAEGYTVIHGGAMSAGAWGNARKHEAIPTTSSVFPTPPAELAEQRAKALEGKCPACGRPVE
jgi:hypothetical protein